MSPLECNKAPVHSAITLAKHHPPPTNPSPIYWTLWPQPLAGDFNPRFHRARRPALTRYSPITYFTSYFVVRISIPFETSYFTPTYHPQEPLK